MNEEMTQGNPRSGRPGRAARRFGSVSLLAGVTAGLFLPFVAKEKGRKKRRAMRGKTRGAVREMPLRGRVRGLRHFPRSFLLSEKGKEKKGKRGKGRRETGRKEKHLPALSLEKKRKRKRGEKG